MGMGRLVRVVAGGVAVAALSVGFVLAVTTSATADTPPAPVSVGSFPLGVTVNPAGTIAYVPSAYAGTVSAIDLATSAVTPITGFSSPWDVAVSSDGSTAYVAQNTPNGPSTIEIADLATNTISGAIPVDGSTDGVALSPDGNTLYAAMGPANQLAEVDLTQSPPAVTYLPNVPAPTDVRVAANGTVYVTSGTAQTLTMIQNGVVSQSQPFVADQSGLVIGGGFIYVSAGDNGGAGTLTMLDATGTVIRTVLVGEQPGRPGLTPDGSTVYVPALTGDNVTEIDTATGNILSTVAGNDNSPAAVAITPDGTLGLVANSVTATVSFFTPRQADSVGSSGPGGGGGAGPTTSAPGAPSTTVSAGPANQSGANELANTGSDPLPVAVFGLVVFGMGVVTFAFDRGTRRRRRAAASE